jgi:hypothetical protein
LFFYIEGMYMDSSLVSIERGSAIMYGGTLLAFTSSSETPNAFDCELERAYGSAYRYALHHTTDSKPGGVYHISASAAASDLSSQLTSVLFVVDDLSQPVRTLLLKALIQADRLGLRQLTVPNLRLSDDPLAHIMDPQFGQALEDMGKALADFVSDDQPRSLVDITVMVSNDFAETMAVQNAFDLALAARRNTTEDLHS